MPVVALMTSVFLLGCEDKRQDYKSAYDEKMRQIETPVSIDTREMNKIWTLTSLGKLYRDPANSKYDSYILEQKPMTETLLLFKDGKFSRARIRRDCDKKKDELDANWLMEGALDPDHLERSRSLQPEFLLDTLYFDPARKSGWTSFALDGQTIQSTKWIGHTREKQPVNSEARVLFVESDEMQIAIIDKTMSNTHTVVEIYEPISGKKLTEALNEAYHAIKNCPPEKK